MRHCYSLFSGGLDSTLAILKIISGNDAVKVTPVFFDYGQRALKEEAKAVSQLIPAMRKFSKHKDTVIADCKTFEIKKNKNVSEGLFSWSQSPILEGRPIDGDVDVENRNMILISCVASVIMSEWKSSQIKAPVELIVGFLNEHYDTSVNFVRVLNGLFEAMRHPIKVVAPLIPEGQKDHVSLNNLVDIARSLNALSLLKNMTWSCYYPQNGNPCGSCHPCSKRKSFFMELGMKELKRKPRKPL